MIGWWWRSARVLAYFVAVATDWGVYFLGPADFGQITDANDQRQRRPSTSTIRWQRFFRRHFYTFSPLPLPATCLSAHDMPRNQNGGNLTHRNRNRVTNKTRLKVIKGNIDADPIVLEEDEDRIRVVSTAGVDAEDANVSFVVVLRLSSSSATTCVALVETGVVARADWLRIFPRHSAECLLTYTFTGTPFTSRSICCISSSYDITTKGTQRQHRGYRWN